MLGKEKAVNQLNYILTDKKCLYCKTKMNKKIINNKIISTKFTLRK